MDPYIFEKVVRATDDVFCQQGKKEWTVELVFCMGGKLGLYFKLYAEVSSI